MDASYKIQRGIHVHLIQFFMCPEFWVHIKTGRRLLRFFAFFAAGGTVFLENGGLAVYTILVIVCKCERGEPYLP